MSPAFAIAIYVLIWWVVLFAVLPLGVRTQGEDGTVVPGTPESAPTRAALPAHRAADDAAGVRWCSVRFGRPSGSAYRLRTLAELAAAAP